MKVEMIEGVEKSCCLVGVIRIDDDGSESDGEKEIKSMGGGEEEDGMWSCVVKGIGT